MNKEPVPVGPLEGEKKTKEKAKAKKSLFSIALETASSSKPLMILPRAQIEPKKDMLDKALAEDRKKMKQKKGFGSKPVFKKKEELADTPVSEQKSKGKSPLIPLHDIKDRTIVSGFACVPSWLNQNFLKDLREALVYQKWDTLFGKKLNVHTSLVEEFYTFLKAKMGWFCGICC